MITTIDNCVGCRTIFGDCRGTACPYHRHEAVVCDECECEDEELYWYEGKMLCKDCLLGMFERVDIEGILGGEEQ